jgi:thermitase
MEAVRVFTGTLGTARRALLRMPRVTRVERDAVALPAHADCSGNPNCLVPDDPLFHRQWGLQNDSATTQPDGTAPTPGADVDAPAAWRMTRGDPQITIALVDTGVDASHPDLAGRVVGSIVVNGAGDSGDEEGHGTGTAGVAAAIPDNGIGVAGVAWNASILNVKVASDYPQQRPTTCDVVAEGIRRAADAGAEVINVDYAYGAGCAALEQAAAYAWDAGSLIIAAAGNGNASYVTYPSAYAHVISVGATDNADQRAWFSQYGEWVDLAAPGTHIVTTFPTYPNASGIQDYASDNGTSDSAPMVAGAAALIWPAVADEDGDGRTNEEVARRLLDYADPVPGADWHYGRLNVCRSAAADPNACPPYPAAGADRPPEDVAPAEPPHTVPDAPAVSSPDSRRPRPRLPALTGQAARARVYRMLRRRLGRRRLERVRALAIECRHTSRSRVACHLHWALPHNAYSGLATVGYYLGDGHVRTRARLTIKHRRR